MASFILFLLCAQKVRACVVSASTAKVFITGVTLRQVTFSEVSARDPPIPTFPFY